MTFLTGFAPSALPENVRVSSDKSEKGVWQKIEKKWMESHFITSK